jgi:glycosyltransferase involved in cell wall biosynthesis
MNLPNYRVAKKMIAINLDLIPLILPDYERLLNQDKARLRTEYTRVVRLADLFVSISQFSKNELCRELSVDPDKVKVVHLGAEHAAPSSTPETSPNLPSNYVLTIGGSEPRKNVITVIKAFQTLPEDIQARFPLLVIGGNWHGTALEFTPNKNVQSLGYVPDDQLQDLYKNASVFVFASKYEGFGFTILEAMINGVPVISSNSSSLTEVAEDAAMLFSPENVNELGISLQKLLASPQLREEYTKKGYKQAEKFSWRNSTEELFSAIMDS